MPHLLYSYRRCPYAMRARMALEISGINFSIIDISLRDKPAEMLEISPKGTVPVLQLDNGQVIDESLDIMHWALMQNDPFNWLDAKENMLIRDNDSWFKKALDRYKYPSRYPDEDCSQSQESVLRFFKQLDEKLVAHKFLYSDQQSIVDIAIFPFIRQASNVDKDWFDHLNLGLLQQWLEYHLNSELFKTIMGKNYRS